MYIGFCAWGKWPIKSSPCARIFAVSNHTPISLPCPPRLVLVCYRAALMVSLLFWAWLVVPLVTLLVRVAYNVFFHPLRNFPGPKMAGATSLWRTYKEVIKKETLAPELFELHKRYGDIVRIAPNELHFGSPSSFHEIYNVSKRWDKDDGLYSVPGFKSGSFVFRKYAQAKERRDVLMPMFSKKAIQNIEGLVACVLHQKHERSPLVHRSSLRIPLVHA